MPTIPFGIQTIHAYSLLELLLGRVLAFIELSMSYPIVNWWILKNKIEKAGILKARALIHSNLFEVGMRN